MNFTYVGEWIENRTYHTTEKRMVADLAYIYENPDEFSNWKDIFNDGADIFVIATGKSRLYLFTEIHKLVKEAISAKVHGM